MNRNLRTWLAGGWLLVAADVRGLAAQDPKAGDPKAIDPKTLAPPMRTHPPVDVKMLQKQDAESKKRRAAESTISEMPEEELKKTVDQLVARAVKDSDSDFPALAEERRRRAMRELGKYPHPYTLKQLKDVLVAKNPPYVKRAAAEALGDMKFERKEVARWMIDRIEHWWKEDEVLVGVAAALGELQEPLHREKMYEYFKHGDDAVYVSMIDAIGAMKDRESLPKLYEIFAQYAGKSTAGVNVRVDTGASGTKDQQQAEARGRGGLKKARVDRREGALHALKQALLQITGQEFDYSDEFYDWLVANSKALGLGELKLRK